MKWMLILGLIAAPCITLAQQAEQFPLTRADSFYEECKRPQSNAACLNYVAGLRDGMWIAYYRVAWKATGKMEGPRLEAEFHRLAGHCPPDSLILGTVYDILIVYLRDNPAERTSTTAAAHAAAMTNAFPCKTPY